MRKILRLLVPRKLRQLIYTSYLSIRRQYLLYINKGDKYCCPFCGYHSKGFYMVGTYSKVLIDNNVVGGGLRASGCYRCDSSDRERLVYIYLTQKLNIINSRKLNKILHIAPAPNLMAKLSSLGLEKYVCGDLYADGYNYNQKVQKMNVTDIPFPSNSFDLVLCNHVLEHVPEDQKAIQEIRRVLRTGGYAILQVPYSNSLEKTFEDFTITNKAEREKVFGQYDHVRIYGRDYLNRLSNNGFKVIQENISKEFIINGVNQDEDIFLCQAE
jgi:SAM-dependent methyltransferase